jgi:hypothetical protein
MNKPASDPLKDLPRLSDQHMSPCIMCARQLVETGLPLFYRIEAKRCGLDANEIRRHVGLAMAIAPGGDGLALAGVLGPKCEPIVVMDAPPAFNVCHECAGKYTLDVIELLASDK